MEAAAEQVSMRSSSSREQSHLVKGKRTKRQRPQSPIPLDSTEEDEEMANCLILLAQCQSGDSQQQQQQPKIQNKFNSRRFLEAPSSGNGKVGYYVYECRTCNRNFPSFQALGGHRTSHKKPKAAMDDERRSNFIVSSNEEEGNHISSSNNKPGSGKVHVCSICGAEFTSGQALGGHMRRHRGPVGTNTASTALSLTPMASSSDLEAEKPRNVLSLDLDLKLPVSENDLRESKLPFDSKQQAQQQKSALVFSAPTLVDCLY